MAHAGIIAYAQSQEKTSLLVPHGREGQRRHTHPRSERRSAPDEPEEVVGGEVVAHLAREHRGAHDTRWSAEDGDVVARRVQRPALARHLRARREKSSELPVVLAAFKHGE